MRFKLKFTVEAETLFALMARMLPIQDLSVEEIMDKPPAAAAKLAREPKLRAPVAAKKRRQTYHHGKAVDLTGGVNAIIVAQLREGPRFAYELRPAVVERGYSANSVTSRLIALSANHFIERLDDGRWQLTTKTEEGAAA